MVAAIVILLITGLIIGVVVYELKTGTLVGRDWKVYAHRQDNPGLYWSSVILQAFIAFMLFGIWILAVLGSNKPGGS